MTKLTTLIFSILVLNLLGPLSLARADDLQAQAESVIDALPMQTHPPLNGITNEPVDAKTAKKLLAEGQPLLIQLPEVGEIPFGMSKRYFTDVSEERMVSHLSKKWAVPHRVVVSSFAQLCQLNAVEALTQVNTNATLRPEDRSLASTLRTLAGGIKGGIYHAVKSGLAKDSWVDWKTYHEFSSTPRLRKGAGIFESAGLFKSRRLSAYEAFTRLTSGAKRKMLTVRLPGGGKRQVMSKVDVSRCAAAAAQRNSQR